MIAACQSNHVKLGIAYYRHCYPAIARIKQIITAREIGTVVFAQINAFDWFNPPSSDPRHWFVERREAGRTDV